MEANPLQALASLGQQVWLDDLRREWLRDGTLARLIAEDRLAGITSNPAIFEKAISAGRAYDEDVDRLAEAGSGPREIYDELTTADVRGAADLFRPLYDESGGTQGYVSLEVSPHLAHETEGTVAEAERLWRRLDRPNVLIKVPGTVAGLPAIAALIERGINVNVTLLFSVKRYREVVDAFMTGLERRRRAGEPLAHLASVASFFLSRIDTLVDSRLDDIGSAEARALRGQAAVACARLAYRHYREWASAPRWRELAAAGAKPQRLLWASTSTKDEAYDEVKYVSELVAPETVNTMPSATLSAWRERGRPEVSINDNLPAAEALPERLAALGIDLEEVADVLEREGVRKFIEPYDALLEQLSGRTGRKPRSRRE